MAHDVFHIMRLSGAASNSVYQDLYLVVSIENFKG